MVTIEEAIKKTYEISNIQDRVKQQGTMIEYGIWLELMTISKQNEEIISLLKIKNESIPITLIESVPDIVVKEVKIKK